MDMLHAGKDTATAQGGRDQHWEGDKPLATWHRTLHAYLKMDHVHIMKQEEEEEGA